MDEWEGGVVWSYAPVSVKSSSSSSGPGWGCWKCSSSTSTSWTILVEVWVCVWKAKGCWVGSLVFGGFAVGEAKARV